ncbi:MAG: hypothetical protein KC657_37395 [Myxococcales bacterium]|nr:hypothetical protein [Myxococcales bacterium]
MDPLETAFQHLDQWRHLPSYQLERRADVFFSVYLKDVVEELTGVALCDEIIPELPIKRDLIWPELPTSKSVKVDYALFARDRSRVFFVELKTDAGSRRDAQDDYLAKAKDIGFEPIVRGVRDIVLATSAHQKYHHLTAALARLGYLRLPADLEAHLYPTAQPGLRALLEAIEVEPTAAAVEVIYLQPEATGGDELCVDFARFAEHVEKKDDALSRMFARALREWRAVAGSRAPGR